MPITKKYTECKEINVSKNNTHEKRPQFFCVITDLLFAVFSKFKTRAHGTFLSLENSITDKIYEVTEDIMMHENESRHDNNKFNGVNFTFLSSLVSELK